jgi:hypothetical protein
MIAYGSCPMEHGATARAEGVPNRPAGGGRWAEIAKKMLFRGNEPKTLLKIKNLAFLGPQNELFFVLQETPIKAKKMAKNPRVDAVRPCSVPVIPPCGRRIPVVSSCRDSTSSSNKNGGLLSRNSMNYSFPLSKLGRTVRKVSYLLFTPPERPPHGSSLIPAGDRYSSRGQRPRKTRPQQGPTLKGSNPGGVTPVLRPAAQGNATPPGSEIERGAFRGRCPRLLCCALSGHIELRLRKARCATLTILTLAIMHPFLTPRIAALRPPMLRMTDVED